MTTTDPQNPPDDSDRQPAPTQAAPDSDALAIATDFHETYERLAPSFGYETRPDTKKFDPTSKNGRLMLAVCKQVVERAHLPKTLDGAAELAAVRLAWLHDCSKGTVDDEGYEWGIFRVKWNAAGQPVSVLQTLSDMSDLDEEMRREMTGLPSPRQPSPAAPTTSAEDRMREALEHTANSLRSLIHTVETIDADERGAAREEKRSARVHTSVLQQSHGAYEAAQLALATTAARKGGGG